jgi:hypothetical protein
MKGFYPDEEVRVFSDIDLQGDSRLTSDHEGTIEVRVDITATMIPGDYTIAASQKRRDGDSSHVLIAVLTTDKDVTPLPGVIAVEPAYEVLDRAREFQNSP